MKIDSKKLKEIIDICYQAGEKLVRFQQQIGQKNKKLKIVNKKSEGLATEADVQTELFIISNLQNSFGHYFGEKSQSFLYLGEELFFQRHGLKSTNLFNPYKKNDYCWILDPLDGTNNFIKGGDYFCISLALAYKGKSIFGLIYAPKRGELYYAVKGKGAFFKKLPTYKTIELTQLKSKSIRLESSPTKKKLSDSLVASGYAGIKGFDASVLRKLAIKSLGMRKNGSAALDLAHITTGEIDAFIAKELAPWDLCAGEIILKESGHFITDIKGGVFNCFKGSIMAGKKGLKPSMKSILS